MSQVWARDLARSLLEEQLPRRWQHSQGVATKAETLGERLAEDGDVLTAAAWLHDVGYSPALVVQLGQLNPAGVYGYHYRGTRSGVRADVYFTFSGAP